MVLAQFAALINITPAYANSNWDKSGKIMPHHKVTIKELPQAVKKTGHKSMPIYRLKGNHLHKIESRQILATTTPSKETAITGTITGLNYDGATPPDVQIAAGPNNVMEMVNLEGQVWMKNGLPEGPTFDLASFFGTGSDYISDPKVLYDFQSDRWFTSITDISTSNVVVGVSVGSDPTGGFCIYNIPGPSFTILDQPIIGISDDKFVISVNDFNSFTQQFTGAQFWTMNKGEMESCSAVNYVTKTFGNYFSIHPVHSVTSTATQYMVSIDGQGSSVDLFSIQGVPPNPVAFSISKIPVSSISNPPSAVQSRSYFKLDTGDYRVQDASWANGALWMANNDMCVPSGDNSPRSCLHLIQLDTNSMSVTQDFEYGIPGKYVFYPAFAENPATGNLLMVFGFSSATDYPGIDVTEQTAADPRNSLETPVLLQAGKGPEDELVGCVGTGACRYGDYFGAALDPSTSSIWVAGEYGSGQVDYYALGHVWATAIGNFNG